MIRVFGRRFQYTTTDGTEVWLPFDPNFPCIYCEKPVCSLSMGGPAVCPSCDTGNNLVFSTMIKAQRRLDALAESGRYPRPKNLK